MITYFEIFVDNGSELGTETIDSALTIQYAIKSLNHWKKISADKVFIDKWVDGNIVEFSDEEKLELKLNEDMYNKHSDNPHDTNTTFNNWDEVFQFQADKVGTNYTILKDWLKKHFENPILKKL